MLSRLVRYSIYLACAFSPLAVASDSPKTALQAYVEGLRTGSVTKLQELFLGDGQFCSVGRESRPQITCKKFSEVLESWTSQPDPAAKGRVLQHDDATPSMSAITYRAPTPARWARR